MSIRLELILTCYVLSTTDCASRRRTNLVWPCALWWGLLQKVSCLHLSNLGLLTHHMLFTRSPSLRLSRISGGILPPGENCSTLISYRVRFPLLDSVLRLEEREKVNLIDLVGALHLLYTSPHALLLASTPSSPVKSGLRMVLSSLVTASLEVASRSFEDPGK